MKSKTLKGTLLSLSGKMKKSSNKFSLKDLSLFILRGGELRKIPKCAKFLKVLTPAIEVHFVRYTRENYVLKWVSIN